MSKISTSQFKAGLKILIDDQPHNILVNEVVKPGKGQAFNRVKIKNLINGRVIEKTFKSGESVIKADVSVSTMTYLYHDHDQWYFMDATSYEQLACGPEVAGMACQWLKEQDDCEVTLWNNQMIDVMPPNFVILKVIDCEPGVKGDTVSGGNKPVTLETAAVLRVPLFIQVGDMIKIDTREQAYVSRVNNS